jgi:hypothetical protein
MFTIEEVRFLSREHATAGLRSFPVVDPSTLKRNKDQSLRVIQRVLETRAKTLGTAFTEFQQSMAPATDLDTSLSAERLF